MKKAFIVCAVMSAIGLMTACGSGKTNGFPENGKDYKILMTEDINICKNYYLQILVDTTYSEDYLLYFTNRFRDTYAHGEKSSVFIYDTAYDESMLRRSMYDLTDDEYVKMANHTLFVASWDDTTYGMYYMLKADDRYRKLTQSK